MHHTRTPSEPPAAGVPTPGKTAPPDFQSLEITVAGRDRSRDLTPGLQAAAEKAVADPWHRQLPPELLATTLRGCRDEPEFLDRLIGLMRRKSHTDTMRFDIPRRPGFAGSVWATIRRKLWKLLRYQHDRVIFRQNMVNTQFMNAIEFERDLLRAEVGRLERRIEQLERSRDRTA